MNAEGEKMDELKTCQHCKGLISIRMPVPSSGCDHLYYPEGCETCRKSIWKEQYVCVVHSSPACNECVKEFKEKEKELEDLRAQCKDYRQALENITRRKESEGIRDIYWAWADDALSKHEGK